MEDKQIVEQFWDRDPQALVHSQEKYGAYCSCIARNILGNEEDAKECVNDTLLYAWNAIPPARPEKLQFYLATVTRNNALDRYRKDHAQKRGGGVINTAMEELAECMSDGDSPQELYQAKELEMTINRFVRSLPARDGNIFIRRYFFLESPAEIGRRYSMTNNHVTVSLSRTRAKLKKYLEKEGFL